MTDRREDAFTFRVNAKYMTEILVILQITTMLLFIYYMVNSNKGHVNNKIVIDKENLKEMDKLQKMRSIQLTQP